MALLNFEKCYADIHRSMPEKPVDLDGYLDASEKQLRNIKPGVQKTIVWRDPHNKAPTEFVILYLHGFSATRMETFPVADLLAHKLGANLFYTRLKGHGQDSASLGRVCLADWLEDTLEALAVGTRIGAKLIMMGMSTGASLAAWAACQKRVPSIAGLVLISPNFAVQNRFFHLLKWKTGRRLIQKVIGPKRSFQPFNDQHAYYWTTSYPFEALFTLSDLLRIVNQSHFDQIRSSVLLIYDPLDKIISIKKIQQKYAELKHPGKQLIPFTHTQDPDHHVLAGDILSPESTQPLVELIWRFFDSVMPLPSPK